jgi:hypothetical protein
MASACVAFAVMAAISPPQKTRPAKTCGDASNSLIRWSVQEIRRIAVRMARRQIGPAHIITWSLWRGAHQAAAKQAHPKSKMQLGHA